MYLIKSKKKKSTTTAMDYTFFSFQLYINECTLPDM